MGKWKEERGVLKWEEEGGFKMSKWSGRGVGGFTAVVVVRSRLNSSAWIGLKIPIIHLVSDQLILSLSVLSSNLHPSLQSFQFGILSSVHMFSYLLLWNSWGGIGYPILGVRTKESQVCLVYPLDSNTCGICLYSPS